MGSDSVVSRALAMDWTVQGSNPVGARFSVSVQTGPGVSFIGVQWQGCGIDHPPLSTAGKE